MSNYNDTAESLPVNYDFHDTSPAGLRASIESDLKHVPGKLAAWILTDLQKNLSQMSEISALTRAADYAVQARIDAILADIKEGRNE